MIRRWSTVSVLLAVLFLLVLAAAEETCPDNGVAQVGETVITQDQLERAGGGDPTKQLRAGCPTKEQDAKAFAEFEQPGAEYLVTLEIIKAEGRPISR